MFRFSRITTIVAVCGALTFCSLAHAQAPGAAGAAGGAGATTGGVTNQGVDSNTTATTMDAGAATTDAPATTGEANVAETSGSTASAGHDKLPNAGGAPLVMVALGLLTAASALLLRRKLA